MLFLDPHESHVLPISTVLVVQFFVLDVHPKAEIVSFGPIRSKDIRATYLSVAQFPVIINIISFLNYNREV